MNDRIEQLHSDYLLTASAFKKARTAVADICKVSEERMQSEREEVAQKLQQLTERQSDTSRSETVRRLAGIELSKLQTWKPSVTVEEREAFAAAVKDAETAIRDMRKIQTEIRTAFEETNKWLKKCRAETLGDEGITLYPSWIDSEKERFSRLCGGEGHV